MGARSGSKGERSGENDMGWIVGAVALATLATRPSLPSAQATTNNSLSSVDYTFVGLTSLGNQFQVDSGKLGEAALRTRR